MRTFGAFTDVFTSKMTLSAAIIVIQKMQQEDVKAGKLRCIHAN